MTAKACLYSLTVLTVCSPVGVLSARTSRWRSSRDWLVKMTSADDSLKDGESQDGAESHELNDSLCAWNENDPDLTCPSEDDPTIGVAENCDELSDVQLYHTLTNWRSRSEDFAAVFLPKQRLLIDALRHQDLVPDRSVRERTDVYNLFKYKDKFLCLPCNCSLTIDLKIIAVCTSNSTIHEINAVLRNTTWDLQISRSEMTSFQADYFFEYRSLTSLKLSNNPRLGKVLPSCRSGQMATITKLDLSHNCITHVSKGSFRNMANLVNISLSNNFIKYISNFTFEGLQKLQILDLSTNKICAMESGSFYHLSDLRVLDITRNRGLGYGRPFESELFSHFRNLTELYMIGNWQPGFDYPHKILAELSNLTILHIDGIKNRTVLEPGDLSLTKLATLHIGSAWDKTYKYSCLLANITSNFLEHMPYLKTFQIKNCPLEHADFSAFRNLTTLELVSAHPYDIFQAFDGLKALKGSHLESLSFTGLHVKNYGYVFLWQNQSQYLRNLELEFMDLSDNQIAYMNPGFINGLPGTLKTLVLRQNKLTEPLLLLDKLNFLQHLELLDLGTYTVADSSKRTDCPDSWQSGRVEISKEKMHLEIPGDEIDLEMNIGHENSATCSRFLDDVFSVASGRTEDSNIHPRLQDFIVQSAQKYVPDSNGSHRLMTEGHRSTAAHTVPPNLAFLLAPRYLEINANRLFTLVIKNKINNLTAIHFSDCGIKLTPSAELPPHIELADFSGNYLHNLPCNFFQPNNSHKYLLLKQNLLGEDFAKDNGRMFHELKNLIYLDISENLIFELQHNFFQGMQSLEVLLMRKNKLQVLNANLSCNPSLWMLDLRKNSIGWITPNTRSNLDIIGEEHSLYIDLTSNPLRCTCEGLDVLHWIWASNIYFVSKDFLRCLRDDSSPEDIGSIDTRVRSLQRQCVGKELILVFCGASLFLICFLVVFGVMYRYRWQLRYIRSIALSRLVGFKPRTPTSSAYKFDAFIVYSDMSRQFVVADCLQELEVKRGHKLCVDDRDFMPGTYNLSAIVSAIQNSRKTVLILSPDFDDEQFSEYSVKMALMEEIYQKRSVLYLCVYQPLPDDEMSKSYDLLMVMKRNNYIEFPPETETSEEIRHNFWDQLSEIIGRAAIIDLYTAVEVTDSQ